MRLDFDLYVKLSENPEWSLELCDVDVANFTDMLGRGKFLPSVSSPKIRGAPIRVGSFIIDYGGYAYCAYCRVGWDNAPTGVRRLQPSVGESTNRWYPPALELRM